MTARPVAWSPRSCAAPLLDGWRPGCAKRKARNAAAVAAAAIEVSDAQHPIVPGLAAAMVARLADEVIGLDSEIANTDAMIEERFRCHAEIIGACPASTSSSAPHSSPPTAGT